MWFYHGTDFPVLSQGMYIISMTLSLKITTTSKMVKANICHVLPTKWVKCLCFSGFKIYNHSQSHPEWNINQPSQVTADRFQNAQVVLNNSSLVRSFHEVEKQSLPFFRACYRPEGTLIQRRCLCLSYHLVLVPLRVWELLLYLLVGYWAKKYCIRKCVFLWNQFTHKTGFSKFLVSTPLPSLPLPKDIACATRMLLQLDQIHTCPFEN